MEKVFLFRPSYLCKIQSQPVKKIKSICAVLLTLLFSVSAGGVFHYCHGELAGFSLFNAHSDVGCGMSDCELPAEGDFVFTSSCCDGYQVQVVVDDYQVSSKPELLLAELDVLPLFSTCLSNDLTVKHSLGRRFYAHPPDLLHEVNLSVIQVYLI